MEKSVEETFDQEPIKVFANFLIGKIEYIDFCLYTTSQCSRAIIPLKGLIACLDANSKNALAKEQEILEKMLIHSGTRSMIEEVYGNILTYLHSTYLQEIHRLRPLNPHPRKLGRNFNE